MSGENTQIRRLQGGDTLEVGATGSINLEAGAKIKAAGTQAAHIPSITDSTGGTAGDTIANTAGANPTTAEFENAVATLSAKVNSILAALRGAGIIASS